MNKHSDGFLAVKRYLGKISSALNYINSQSTFSVVLAYVLRKESDLQPVSGGI